MGDAPPVDFGHDRGWIWWVFPTNAFLALIFIVVAFVFALYDQGFGDIDWSGALLVTGVMQVIGLATSACAVAINSRRDRIVYRVSDRAIACYANGVLVQNVDPSRIESWRMGDRLIPILDHLMFHSSPTTSRRNGPALHLWLKPVDQYEEISFPPLIVFSRSTYRSLLKALDLAAGIPSIDHGGPLARGRA